VECRTALEQLTEYLEGRLPQQSADVMREHLATCSSCSRAAADVGAVVRTLRALPAAPLPAGFEPALRQRLDRASSPPLGRFVLAAAAGALLVIISFGILRMTKPSAIPAAGRLQRGRPVAAEKAIGLPAVPPPALSARTPEQYVSPSIEQGNKAKVVAGASPAPKMADESEGAKEARGAAPGPAPTLQPHFGIAPPQAASGRNPEPEKVREQQALEYGHEKALPPLAPAPRERARAVTQSDVGAAAEPAPSAGSKQAAAAGAAAPTTTAAPALKRRVEVVPMPPSWPSAHALGIGRGRGAGWLANARVRLAPRTAQQRAPVAVSVEFPAVQQQSQTYRQKDQVQPEVRISASVRPIVPPGPPLHAETITVPAVQAPGARADIPINLPRETNRPRAPFELPYGQVYELALSTEQGQSVSFLLFTPGVRRPRWAPSFRGRPVDALRCLSSDAGVRLLTPVDLGADLVVTIAAPPADALTALLATLRMDVHRDGDSWTASRS